MRLLILTQKVDINDDVLGFFHSWVAEFAKHCESVTVICLYMGEHDLPSNVKVLSLGKERITRLKDYKIERLNVKISYLFKFYKYIWQERKSYDAVFVHMNQIYIILGALVWKFLNKGTGLWYAHGKVSNSLVVAEKMTDIIFTSTPGGFRMKSQKLHIVGQGIDSNKFRVESEKYKANGDKFKIISIGRISPVKDFETLVKAADILKKEGLNFSVEILGGPGTAEQAKYFEDLKLMVITNGLEDFVNFVGPVSNRNIVGYLTKADLFINTSNTGSLDKVILEAMACNLPVISCNEAFLEIFSNYKNNLFFTAKDATELAQKINGISNLSIIERNELGKNLRNIVVADHSLSGLIKKILSFYK